MDPGEQRALHDFVRAHHVHYEVEPEEVADGRRRELVGVRLRLLAVHATEKVAAPGDPPATELLGELQAFADRVAAEAGLAGRAEAIPAARKLYQSEEERDADEVALTLRVHCEAPEHRQPGAGEDRCLATLRDRLAELGVQRR